MERSILEGCLLIYEVNNPCGHNSLQMVLCSWNVSMIQATVTPYDIPLILSLKPSHGFGENGYYWHYTNFGNNIVKSGYEISRLKLDEDLTFLLQKPSLNYLKDNV